MYHIYIYYHMSSYIYIYNHMYHIYIYHMYHIYIYISYVSYIYIYHMYHIYIYHMYHMYHIYIYISTNLHFEENNFRFKNAVLLSPWSSLGASFEWPPPGKKFVCCKKSSGAQQDAIDDAPWGKSFDTCKVFHLNSEWNRKLACSGCVGCVQKYPPINVDPGR